MALLAGQRMATAPATTDALLAALRAGRAFEAEGVLASKVGRINGWFSSQRLDAAVIGLSGGLDSALTLALLKRAQAEANSPLRRILALILPIEGPGSTGQSEAAERAHLVARSLDAEVWEIPLEASHGLMLGGLEQASALVASEWVAGQMLAVERTPVLYGAAALLQQHGHRSVVVGTTNRDEGAYLGFFGKASDAMVDLQPIADLHKSEVLALARLLRVPHEVIDAPPRGDVFDGRTDAEMIGASYGDVEMVLRLRELGREIQVVADGLSDGASLLAAAAAVEVLHQHNSHKYRVGSPAAFLDVMPRGVPGGWHSETLSGRAEGAAPQVPGAWSPPTIHLSPLRGWPVAEDLGAATLAHEVLSEQDCVLLLDALSEAPAEPVSVTGVRDDAGHPDEVGSTRSTAFARDLADQLWARLAPVVASVRFLNEWSATDGHQAADRPGHRTWRVVGLSPLLRFMSYEPEGRHLCHYDAAFDYGDGRRTLQSVVFYLTGDGAPASGGATRLVNDQQQHLETWRRDHSDWTRDTLAAEVSVAVAPLAGSALIFDHRRCHDVETWVGPGSRVIIRADVVYEAVPDGQALG